MTLCKFMYLALAYLTFAIWGAYFISLFCFQTDSCVIKVDLREGVAKRGVSWVPSIEDSKTMGQKHNPQPPNEKIKTPTVCKFKN